MSGETSNADKLDGIGKYADVKGLRRDRPWLLPSNRKLRHLQGISLRNLELAIPSSRTRGKTFDDESLPQSWKSPMKLLAQRENKLEHSRSSGDLKVSSLKASPAKEQVPKVSRKEAVEPRPPGGRLRRRSTLNWTGASPDVRQKKLEDVTRGRMADTWFSLHSANNEGPIYVSEVVDKAMNASYRFFDLNIAGPLVTRLNEVIVKFWAKGENMPEYHLLIELQLHLRSLQFIGKSVRLSTIYSLDLVLTESVLQLESFHHPLPSNCILFHLSDGVYTSFTDMPPDEPPAPFAVEPPKALASDIQPTSSYEALMRLSTLDDCIQDALTTREKLASQINSILEKNQEPLDTVNEAEQALDSFDTAKRYVAVERKQLRSAAKRRADLKTSLDARRDAMHKGSQAQAKAEDYLSGATDKLKECHRLVESNTESLHGQRRRICEDLMRIYPIDAIPKKTLAFTICGLPLPNSNFDSSDEDVVAAALGFVAHIVYLLSFYLSVPLPYPVQAHGSTSLIRDPISLMAGQRTFPLYLKGSIQYRFDYAVFLLNKDIELLMSRQGLKVLDLRQTLPNLKYLLYVTAAGTSELPARKAGGVRGLMMGRLTPSMSRRESEESTSSGFAGDARTLLENEGREESKNKRNDGARANMLDQKGIRSFGSLKGNPPGIRPTHLREVSP
ncbi:MAG: hypothetical protein M1827_006346 [Pycnora praestabilis]|nr:MAG: hypothetical protein M1827_006346 [Pycnora praestabilis]